MPATAPATSSIVFLSDVDWETYESLRGVDGNRNLRMTYDRGTLAIMSPSKLHERAAELLAQLIVVWTDELGIPRQSCGSTTLKKEQARRGVEPDKCFYIENEAAVRERDEHDSTIDPPPDLAIEVDVSSSSDVRMPIYADLGIGEIWRWKDDQLDVFTLNSMGQYILCNKSLALPGFPIPEAADVLRRRLLSDETSLLRGFRECVRASRR